MSESIEEARKTFGRLVRQARQKLGMTQEELRALIHCGQPKISRIEKGEAGVSETDAVNIAKALGFPLYEQERFKKLAGKTGSRQRRAHWSDAKAWVPVSFRDVYRREPHAKEILGLHGDRLPGLLQSDWYMLRQHELAHELDKNALAAHLTNRNERQMVLKNPDPPDLHFILSESCLRRVPGGDPSLQRDSAQHLLTLLDDYPTLNLHLVSRTSELSHFPTDFTLLRFGELLSPRPTDRPVNARLPRAESPEDFAHLEQPIHGVNVYRADQVTAYLELWDSVFKWTSGRTETKTLIEQFLKEIAP